MTTIMPTMGSTPPRPLLFELYNSRALQCSQPHDLIYALLHVSANTTDIPIDYAIPVEELYFAVAAQMAKHSVLMLQALLACATVLSSSAVPSWVPDWRTGFDEKSLDSAIPIGALCRRIAAYEKSGKMSIEPSVKVDGQTLLMQGSILQPCFHPAHTWSEGCDTCRLITPSWENVWLQGLDLASMAAKNQVLFVITDHEDFSIAYVLTRTEQVTSSQRWPAYQLGGLCLQMPFKKCKAELPTLSTIQLI
ncbi:hypothetical protein LTR56_003516 [Elasticomyces elasticus]|nr:hypothetical protein LTR22_017844 [Elasticomyces elasticus]KAK3655509.1 hypothetical protein LTR56_003516 [Elasticomyces elasticus]KAK4917469.1 hypothetical protein LTR49_014689 [Elasticomyces elasticus]KAK5752550.1 hypothetical protein LTS12_017392 [Elasticomyces elasticus]